jgi:hypothetical protein
MITSLAQLGEQDDAHGDLLDAPGWFAWKAGPPSQSAGLCHGSAGNGFAFLALFARTATNGGSSGHARSRARHRTGGTTRAVSGRGRYTLFTGDLGAALLAAACITLNPAFPGIDDL